MSGSKTGKSRILKRISTPRFTGPKRYKLGGLVMYSLAEGTNLRFTARILRQNIGVAYGNSVQFAPLLKFNEELTKGLEMAFANTLSKKTLKCDRGLEFLGL